MIFLTSLLYLHGYADKCFSDYPYFKEHYKFTGLKVSKQQALDVNLTLYSRRILLVIVSIITIQQHFLLKATAEN